MTNRRPAPTSTSRSPNRQGSLLRLVRRVVVALVGAVVTLVGLVMIPLIGPGWLVVFTGLAILSTEFRWAGTTRDWLGRKLRSMLTRNRQHDG